MYETEICANLTDRSELPEAILNQFSKTGKSLTHRSLISWAEHCTECTMPGCFSTCEYYTPRADLKCRRFEEGITGIEVEDGYVSHLMKIKFRKWGKLEGRGTILQVPVATAVKKEISDQRISSAQNSLPLPYNLKVLGIRARSRMKAPKEQTAGAEIAVTPNCFVLECYNPSEETITISVTMRPDTEIIRTQFQHFIELKPGYTYERLPIEDVTKFIRLDEPFLVQVQPQPDRPGLTLYFGILDFAVDHEIGESLPMREETPKTTGEQKKIKCVVWDLDNTLWAGTLIEDGADNLVLNQKSVDLIKDLDSRGILNSIASKNNAEDAIAVLEKFSLLEYFLYPDISWEPKSLAIKRIAKNLNIGIDTFAFIDDQPFERAEVSETVPDVLCFDVVDIDQILAHPAFDVPVTADGKNRRLLYKSQVQRESAMEATGGDYENFLKSCNLVLTAEPLTEKSLDRVYELAQRTNQMNFTGNRYPRKTLSDIMENPDLDTYVLGCEDRFGDYGIIGFSIVRKSDATMQDLMFSCRIQSKRVDHAFLTHVISKYHEPDTAAFKVEYKQSPKNTPSAQIFSEMGFVETEQIEDKSILSYPQEIDPPKNEIVTVKEL